ncbi:class A beta-lactamase [Pseudoduganella sp. UC29_106]|uniref:class A beta-lactamase n=1 Tax=Pseudoduganella sp. UC29_106 TaxID=3374553 RepID=UPI003757A16D
MSTRRQFLLATASVSAFPSLAFAAAPSGFAALEEGLDGQIGVYAIDTGSGKEVAWRADEAFPMCSTFKAALAASLLERSVKNPKLMQKRIRYDKRVLLNHCPITEKHLHDGMPIEELCAAAVAYSDNAAANLLLKEIGGPAQLTAFLRSIGDQTTRLDRWEPELNTSIPGDLRDTTTPRAMTATLRKLALDKALPPAQQARFQEWLVGNTTGDERIRAGVPSGWKVGDKTGTGPYGATNDIGVIWPAGRAPIVLSIYLRRNQPKADNPVPLLAAATRLVLEQL